MPVLMDDLSILYRLRFDTDARRSVGAQARRSTQYLESFLSVAKLAAEGTIAFQAGTELRV